MVEATGRIDVPQTPDLIYQFLPIRWGTIRHAGVELLGLVYDSVQLDPYREDVPRGFFRPEDAAAPFYVDKHDLSRIWFRDPETNRVVPVPWRRANRTDAPMTDKIVEAARRRIRDRGGNTILKRGSATRQILEELTELTRTPTTSKRRRKLNAAARRVEQSRRDHDEAQRAIDTGQSEARSARETSKPFPDTSAYRRVWPNFLDED
jgi:hypothetical protein